MSTQHGLVTFAEFAEASHKVWLIELIKFVSPQYFDNE